MKCKECNKTIETCYSNKEELLALKQCFNCNFWSEYYLRRNEKNIARINGGHYMIGKEDDNSAWRGFAGQKFIIQFDDGRRVTTTNLWHQGTIPEHFRDRLPDNAKFLEK